MPLVTREGRKLWYREDVYEELFRDCKWRAWVYGLGGLVCVNAFLWLFELLGHELNIPGSFGFACGAMWCHMTWVQLWQIRELERRHSLYPTKDSGFEPPPDEAND